MPSREPTPPWQELSREVPTWFRDAKLGIFVHWGAYSVPAWADPTGEPGAVDEATWFRHPYAEWYANRLVVEIPTPALAGPVAVGFTLRPGHAGSRRQGKGARSGSTQA